MAVHRRRHFSLGARKPHVDKRKRGTSYDEHLNGTHIDTLSIRDEYGEKKLEICSPRKSVEMMMLRGASFDLSKQSVAS
jgi:hypothetical protein